VLNLGVDKRRVAVVWQKREKTEREAASLFAHLAVMLNNLNLPPALVQLAARASKEEASHALDCRRIIRATGIGLEELSPEPIPFLGPPELSLADRALYTSVAMGCITETLSAALLLEMNHSTTDPLIREIVHKILTDEIGHSRLGWEHLRIAGNKSNVSWLGNYLPAMLDEVLTEETPHPSINASVEDLSGFGILSRSKVQTIFRDTIDSVLIPGFEIYGIQVGPAQEWAGKTLAA
jgi:hypothetical protein